MASLPSAPLALTALAASAASQPAASSAATSAHPATNAARPTQAPVQASSNGAGTSPSSTQLQVAGSSTAGVQPGGGGGSNGNPLIEFLLKTWIGNLVAILGLIATCIALVWTLYSGIVSLKITIWTAGNDALDTCLSLRDHGEYSSYCNKTIHHGIEAPPINKGAPSKIQRPSLLTLPVKVSATIVLHLAVVILTTIYFHPRIALFRPIVSIARTHLWRAKAIWSYTWQYAQIVICIPLYTITKHANDPIWTSATENEDCTTCHGPDEPLFEDTGDHHIGVSYVSDNSDDEHSEPEKPDTLADDDDADICFGPDHGDARADDGPPTPGIVIDLEHWLQEHSRDLVFSKIWVGRKIMSLPAEHLKELSTDVHDEVLRRERRTATSGPAHDILASEPRFSVKRNRARATLSMLPTINFSQMVKDVLHEHKRREELGRNDDHSRDDFSKAVRTEDQGSIIALVEACAQVARDLEQSRNLSVMQGHNISLNKVNAILNMTITAPESDNTTHRFFLPEYSDAELEDYHTDPVVRSDQELRHLADLIPDWVGGHHNRENLMQLIKCIRVVVSGSSASHSPEMRLLQEQCPYDRFIDVVTLRGLLRYLQAVKEELSPPNYPLCDMTDRSPTDIILTGPDGDYRTPVTSSDLPQPLHAPSRPMKTFDDIGEPLTAVDTPKGFLRNRSLHTVDAERSRSALPSQVSAKIKYWGRIPVIPYYDDLVAPDTDKSKQKKKSNALSRLLRRRGVKELTQSKTFLP